MKAKQPQTPPWRSKRLRPEDDGVQRTCSRRMVMNETDKTAVDDKREEAFGQDSEEEDMMQLTRRLLDAKKQVARRAARAVSIAIVAESYKGNK